MTQQELLTTTDVALAEHAAVIKTLGKRVVADVIEIGGRLTECKLICGHGNWLPWLDREFGWEESTALRFMRVHELSIKSSNLPDLEIPVSGLYLLAAPSTPEAACDAVIEHAQNGEHLTHARVKEMIAKAKAETADEYEARISRLIKRYDDEREQLRRDLKGMLSPEAIDQTIEEALKPLQDKIKRLEDERAKRHCEAPKRADPFGRESAAIANRLRDFAVALTISPEQLIQHQQMVADATHRTLEETNAELMANAGTAKAWLEQLVKKE
jgi:hypothetical protein